MNGRRVGDYSASTKTGISFQYDPDWLSNGFAVSRQLPMTDRIQRGDAVAAVFENLLPDNTDLRRKLAERTEARSARPHDLLSVIGRDCVGAMQFVPRGEDPGDPFAYDSSSQTDAQIADTLRSLATSPLGMRDGEPFRISLAGAQEKTAYFRKDGTWHRPLGMTPTTHIFKRPMGVVSQHIDMSDSVENEYLCLRLTRFLGLPVNDAAIGTFEDQKALIVTRFDRRARQSDGRLLRMPQEDFLQAMGLDSAQKYQEHGGPNFEDCAALTKGSAARENDMGMLVKAQVVFWLLQATDGHAKNFSIEMLKDGYRMTPLYDILSAAPHDASGGLRAKDIRMAISVGDKRRYRMDQIHPRHFAQSAARAGIPPHVFNQAVTELAERGHHAINAAATDLPESIPDRVASPILELAKNRMHILQDFVSA
ncbi:HipA domain-containing protein [Shimia sp. R11_0]|uniref:HipA domain-containing protein n=1 Tax=Shimia sp. R11_0 TaxID=2821096 RepID=UPI001FFE2365|nr:HipA domain-containing protein [Shimia sp. R11_0]